ncbi:MAG: penicillin-binding protein 1C [Candidatus Aminicenantes bacterium]|nr:penicillin-binding protein 1C [Candidatus Aminicenantes bacterium]
MRRIRIGPAVLAALGLAAAGSLVVPIPRSRLSPLPVLSLNLTDRSGLPLREVLSDQGGRSRWIGPAEISPHAVRALIAAEDRRFPFHPGIDLFALGRAMGQALVRGRVVSGASTISQQLVRNIYHYPRTIPSKIAETWLALRLERTLSKGDILVQYLNRVAYGRQAYGLEAAARFYFDKPARDLSPSEAAYLTALPRAPGRLRPERDEADLLSRRNAILRRMARLGFISPDTLGRALAEPVRVSENVRDFRAPHFVEYLLTRLSPEERESLAEIRTTLDLPLQTKIERLLDGHLRSLEKKNLTNGAVIVLENATGAVRAMVGSKDFFDEPHAGQVNGANSLRQPGSTLKPLTYALALENGMTAATLIDDAPAEFGPLESAFSPDNYDERYHGPVRLRSALASSYNIPAVAVLDLLGPELLFRKLREMGFGSLKKDASYYGAGLTLGNGEVTLLELARAYAALAEGGLYRPERLIETASRKGSRMEPVSVSPPVRVFSRAAAFIVTDILADRDARVPAFGYRGPLNLPFPAAAKTGTSKDFRDNWTVGYTPRYTVAVWTGNFDGSPMHNVSGITGAGPLFRDCMLLLEENGPGLSFPEPPGLVRVEICPLSGERPGPSCPASISELFIEGTAPNTSCRLSHRGSPDPASLRVAGKIADPVRVIFPADGDVFKIDPILRPEYQTLGFKARIETRPEPQTVEWHVDGIKAAVVGPPFSWTWKLRPGSYTIHIRAVIVGKPVESRRVRIRVLS